ncbi:MAG TPA: tetratricopeptide repeat protein [Thermoanaerobaculia bacterium]|nr:tetratricopeptide repeat protein [Thermoanaerobaculia bacterium]
MSPARPEPAPVAKILGWPEATPAGGPVAELPAKPLGGLKDGTGEELLAELVGRPKSERISLLRSDRRLQTSAVLRSLIERSLEQAILDPGLEEDLARLALDLARILTGSAAALPLEDLRACAWASVGNARRLRFDFTGADEAFEKAFSHLRRGAAEPESRALVLRLLASLRGDQRRLVDALRLLEQALDLLEEAGDIPGTVLLLVKISALYEQGGRPEPALEALRKALERFDSNSEDFRLLLHLKHNLATNLAGAGRFAEAAETLAGIGDLYNRFPDPWTRNRRTWLEARISRGMGDPGRAESLFLAARQGFFAQGSAYDAALVSLELASLYTEQGKTADVTRIAVEIFPIFSSQRIDREARATLALLDLTPTPV